MTNPNATTGFVGVAFGGAPCSNLSDAANKSWVRILAERINKILQGKVNVVLPITLAANAGTTTITDARIGYYSGLLLSPTTAHAAAALATTYFSSQVAGAAVITHTNDANADKTFNLVILG